MASKYSRISGVIENIDRFSELPEPIMLHILSRLPLEDSARASVLSKLWKSVCSLNPILYYDHSLFALRSLVGGDEREREHEPETDINQIRDMFLDDVHDGLSRAMHLDSPIRKLALKVAFNDSTRFSRLDTCLELVKHMKVHELCVFVQSVGCLWNDYLCNDDDDDLYEFQISALASKHLHSVYIRGCILSDKTFVGNPINNNNNKFCSLKRLSLSNVLIENSVFENLAKCCGGIETLVLDDCTVNVRSIELSRFPKLKNALIKIAWGQVNHIGIVDTNFECFKCQVYTETITECRISPAACASIKELTLVGCTINQPSVVFADFAATFPLVEEAYIYIHDTETFNVVSNLLRNLTVCRHCSVLVKEAIIDCPRLTSLDCYHFSLVQLYVNCPKLRVLRYRADVIPKQIFFSPMSDLEEVKIRFTVDYACDTLWFIDLTAFLAFCLLTTRIKVVLVFLLSEVTFEPERVEAIQAFPRHNIHLALRVPYFEENVAATVDAMLFIIHPTTFVGYNPVILNYLCENLMKKSEDKICDEEGSSRCWLDQLDDFRVNSSLGILDIKTDNLLDQPGLPKDICFHFFWSS